ncbi:ABC transporter substrate-binding protein [Erwiniaceae bacterium BAC15a-03b]|uniref:ABC transporter substrate-binding protein n=1 Tax=Winslowiella arboricola TaxID=2978220 RepID=A0A9J6PRM4_9GAMM|nr:ABC transporter substrate-binding protein [Winslowiella arboricola]MCU5772513.1 ABC transporter substrate-binding protein [Winslowiella arboricola]MCU5779035.1 ABC transporter substrate-binding protein [Winslowiella arboricola]
MNKLFNFSAAALLLAASLPWDAALAATVDRNASLSIAYGNRPGTLDPYLTTNNATSDVDRNIFEELFTINEKFEPVAELVKSYTLSDDRKTYTFTLRDGIHFHNGQLLTADDVVASMNRWLAVSTQGKANLAGAQFSKVDTQQVQLTLQTPSLITLNILADVKNIAAIMPKSIIDEANSSKKPVSQLIGTGPYKLAEFKQGEYLHLTRYDNYVSRSEPASGLSGQKKADVKDIWFRYITDESTRLAGAMTGEYDIVFNLPKDNIDTLQGAPEVQLYQPDSGGSLITFLFNKNRGPFASVKLRQAFNLALDVHQVLLAGYSDPRFFKEDPSLGFPQQVDWYSEAGRPFWNQHKLDEARKLVKESGYNGEEVVIIATKEYAELYNLAIVAQQVLKQIGVKSRLDVYDWPTVLQRRQDPNNFDLCALEFSMRQVLHQYPFLDSRARFPGLSNSPEIDGVLDAIKQAPSLKEAKPLVDQLNQLSWRYLPVIVLGHTTPEPIAIKRNIHGYQDLIGPVLWNISVSAP